MSDVQTITTLAEWSTAVRTRDGCCTACGATSNLHAHHIKRKSQHPELALDLDNGTTLCNTCHAKEHESDFPGVADMLINSEFRKATGKKRAEPVELPEQPPTEGPFDLKTTLKRLGIRQSGFASRVGCDEDTVSRWCTGKTDVPGPIREYIRILTIAYLILHGSPHT